MNRRIQILTAISSFELRYHEEKMLQGKINTALARDWPVLSKWLEVGMRWDGCPHLIACGTGS